ncbi:MAG: 3-deoxy-manno-octulosonate cytidylyltransferase [Halobacteriota archaeon]
MQKINKPKIVVIIPARYDSTRFEGKPLAKINEKPMIYYVYQRSKKAKGIDAVIVATDDERIKNAVEKFNGKVVMTSKEHKSGTERVAEVAKKIDADIIVNVQGDEPLIEPKAIEEVVMPLVEDKNIRMSTLMIRITNEAEYNDANIVKVVTDKKGFALYFSRSLIPYPGKKEHFKVYKHIGIYVYRKDFLLELADMQQTPLEQIECLEQLRVLENGFKIKVVETNYDSISVDTPKDLEVVKKFINRDGM